ncbi:MAG TPA: hypothetical protein VL284_08550 [Thermoanaerobaculia bacterium]|nr:hypothetical protein [Thermoanaerobaculia bacterium]
MTAIIFLAAIHMFRMGGDIRVPDAPHGAWLHTMGGDIVVERGAGAIVAKTMGGNIDIDSLRGSAEAGTMGGEIRVSVDGNGPGHNLDLSSLGGDIELTLPANFDGNFDIAVEEGEHGSLHHITSDFPLSVRDSTRWHFFEGSRIVHAASGRSGSGVNRVHISTIGGNVTIRKK